MTKRCDEGQKVFTAWAKVAFGPDDDGVELVAWENHERDCGQCLKARLEQIDADIAEFGFDEISTWWQKPGRLQELRERVETLTLPQMAEVVSQSATI